AAADLSASAHATAYRTLSAKSRQLLNAAARTILPSAKKPAWTLWPKPALLSALILNLSLQQRQHVLRICIRDLQHRGARLYKYLSPRQVGRFRGEVGVANRAFGVGQIDQRIIKGVLISFERRSLEGAQSTAERSDLVDRFGDDLCRGCRIGREVGRTALT